MSKVDYSNYRFERKFFISGMTKDEVESVVKFNPAMFSESFHQRFVNNIYFDSVDLRNYHDNIDGSTHRNKFRIRWYGELFGPVNKPVLEIKIKNGFLGRKESFLLHPFKIDNSFKVLSISNIIEKSDIPEIVKMKLGSLDPVLINRYSRKYFQTPDKNYRITIDTDLVFYRLSYSSNSFLNKLSDDINVILELKYGHDMDDRVDHITAHFPFRLSKSSKYVTAISKLYNW